jgi:hypothetical protein
VGAAGPRAPGVRTGGGSGAAGRRRGEGAGRTGRRPVQAQAASSVAGPGPGRPGAAGAGRDGVGRGRGAGGRARGVAARPGAAASARSARAPSAWAPSGRRTARQAARRSLGRRLRLGRWDDRREGRGDARLDVADPDLGPCGRAAERRGQPQRQRHDGALTGAFLGRRGAGRADGQRAVARHGDRASARVDRHAVDDDPGDVRAGRARSGAGRRDLLPCLGRDPPHGHEPAEQGDPGDLDRRARRALAGGGDRVGGRHGGRRRPQPGVGRRERRRPRPRRRSSIRPPRGPPAPPATVSA